MDVSIYLDNSATTRVFDSVAQRVLETMTGEYYNPSSAYAPALRVEKQLNECRKTLALAVGARDAQVTFTGGGTESDNLAILGTALLQRKKMRFLYSAIEHSAVKEAMACVQDMGHDVQVIPVDGQGKIDLTQLDALLSEDIALVSCMQVNNEVGTIQPLASLAKRVKDIAPKALLHVDGVQGFLRVPTNLDALGIDLYSVSAHKFHGPKGIGALIARKGVRLKPLLLGGGQEGGLRSGTHNVPGILGMGEAVLAYQALSGATQALREMKTQLLHRLTQGDAQIVCNGMMPEAEESAPHILNVSFPGVRGEVMLHALEAKEIYVSTGSACATHKMKSSSVLREMGIGEERAQGAIRISLSPQNTLEEIETAAQEMLRAYAQLKQFRRR